MIAQSAPDLLTDRHARLFSGVTAARIAELEPLTPDQIVAAIESVGVFPPAPLLGSSRLFPEGGAWNFTFDGRRYILAHPSFWRQVPRRELDEGEGMDIAMGSVELVDLDAPDRRRDLAFALEAVRAAARVAAPPTPPRSRYRRRRG